MAYKRTDAKRANRKPEQKINTLPDSKKPKTAIDNSIWENPYSIKKYRDPFKKTYPSYGPQTPINNAENHERLLMWIKERMDLANESRDDLVARYAYIDQEISGYLILNQEDKKREIEYRQGKSSKPVDQKIQFAATQLDDMETYLMSVFAPETGMFEALARKDQQPVANAFATKLNKDADRMSYYAEIALGLKCMLRYDIGGWVPMWKELKGLKPGNDSSGLMKKSAKVSWKGTHIKAIDVYNTLLDPAHHPSQVALFGEFFATVDVHRQFTIEKMLDDGEIVGGERFLESCNNNITYYKPKPNIRGEQFRGTGQSPDWVNVLSAGSDSEAGKGFEVVKFCAWVRPKRFGISEDVELQVWEFTIIGMQYIAAMRKVENTHSMLPICLAKPSNDLFGLDQKSSAEMLLPLQRFASYLFNIHQRAARKALYGLLFYDAKQVPLQDHLKDDLESAQIPVNLVGTDKKLQDIVLAVNNAPDTGKIMDQINNVLQLMQHMLPTNLQQAMANLDRATQYQAATVAQGANKRNLKLAKIIDDQAFKNLRFILMWNMYDKQDNLEMIGPDGAIVSLEPSKLRDTELEFTISDGLKGIDRLALMSNYNEIYGKMVQIPGISQQVDMLGLINYLSSLMGDKTDLTQFKLPNGIAQVPPEVQAQIMTLYQSGELQVLFAANAKVKAEHQKEAAQIAAMIVPSEQDLPGPPAPPQQTQQTPGAQ